AVATADQRVRAGSFSRRASACVPLARCVHFTRAFLSPRVGGVPNRLSEALSLRGLCSHSRAVTRRRVCFAGTDRRVATAAHREADLTTAGGMVTIGWWIATRVCGPHASRGSICCARRSVTTSRTEALLMQVSRFVANGFHSCRRRKASFGPPPKRLPRRF